MLPSRQSEDHRRIRDGVSAADRVAPRAVSAWAASVRNSKPALKCWLATSIVAAALPCSGWTSNVGVLQPLEPSDAAPAILCAALRVCCGNFAAPRELEHHAL